MTYYKLTDTARIAVNTYKWKLLRGIRTYNSLCSQLDPNAPKGAWKEAVESALLAIADEVIAEVEGELTEDIQERLKYKFVADCIA